MTTRRRRVRDRKRVAKWRRSIKVPALRAISPAQELEDGTSIWFACHGDAEFYGRKKGRRISRRRRLWRPQHKPAAFWFALPSDLERLGRIKSRRKRKGYGRKRRNGEKRMRKKSRDRFARLVRYLWKSLQAPSRRWFTLEPQ